MDTGHPESIVTITAKSELSRKRLLDAAEILFAEKGYDKTTVREITESAKCNVASINYHFQNKDNLYREVYIRRVRQLREIRIAAIEQVMSRGSKATLEDLIRSYAQSFLEPMVQGQSRQALMKLMTRELNEPRLPKETFFDEMVWPVQEQLEKAIKIFCPGIDRSKNFFSIQGIVGQLLHFIRMHDLHQTHPRLPAPPETHAMIEYLTRFSSAGIRALAGKESGA